MSEITGSGSLSPERWRRISALLNRALELDPDDRAKFLDEGCAGDPPLRHELDSLLKDVDKSAWIDKAPAGFAEATQTIHPEPGNAAALKPGQELGHYRIDRKLGQGGMGVVYKAIDTQLGRPVALKILLRENATWQQRERFAREAKAASALNHPNIVTIYEFNRHDEFEFIAMEYIDGITLRDALLAKVPRETLLNYARQAANAIGKAHTAGIVHRDLKPTNIMITQDGIAKVLDFGLAKQEEVSDDPEATHALTVTREGHIVGTPAYMAPEQVAGKPIDFRADIFSFGILLYELLCGQRPFQGVNEQATLYEIAVVEPRNISEIDSTVPAHLAALVHSCLAKAREDRPQSMREVVRQLNPLEEAAPVAYKSRRKVLVSIAGVAVVAAGASWWLSGSPDNPRSLLCSLVVQKMNAGSAIGEPYVASPTDTFEAGWKFRLRAQSKQAGYLYVLNDGPDERGTNQLWALYPDGDARLEPAAPAETGWFVFDQNPGTEHLWIVWAGQPIAELTGVTGQISDADKAAKLRALLDGLKSEGNSPETIEIRGKGPVLGKRLALRHR